MKKSRIAFMAILMAMIMVTTTVLAVTGSLIDTTKKGSLTITALEQENGSTATTGLSGLAGVEYSIYLVDDTIVTVDNAETAIANATAAGVKVTNDNGVAKFENLNLGRYYAKVTSIPEGTSEVPASFLVDIPRTNASGDGWTYDVEAFPKVKTANGSFSVLKRNMDYDPIEGAKFQLQYKTDGEWSNLGDELTTNAQGRILYENLPSTMEGKKVTYRVIETSAPDGYIVDNTYVEDITIDENGVVRIGNNIGSNVYVNNDKPSLVKKVKDSDGEWVDSINAGIEDTIEYGIFIYVPDGIQNMSVFELADTLPEGMNINEESINVYVDWMGVNSVDINVFDKKYGEVRYENGEINLSIDCSKSEGPFLITLTYVAKLDAETAVASNVNNAVLTYTVNTDTKENATLTDDAEVTTGSLKIKKVDTASAPLQGAKFKIATTKANAEAGTFMKTADGADIEVTSGADGYATINALADGEYYLVETESPTYVDDNGETQHYLLLSSPKKVTVNGETEVEVVNKKQTLLPLTGGIGSALFVIAGSALVIVSKKMKKEEE